MQVIIIKMTKNYKVCAHNCENCARERIKNNNHKEFGKRYEEIFLQIKTTGRKWRQIYEFDCKCDVCVCVRACGPVCGWHGMSSPALYMYMVNGHCLSWEECTQEFSISSNHAKRASEFGGCNERMRTSVNQYLMRRFVVELQLHFAHIIFASCSKCFNLSNDIGFVIFYWHCGRKQFSHACTFDWIVFNVHIGRP